MPDGLTKAEITALGRKADAATLAALSQLGGEAHRSVIRALALEVAGFSTRELAEPAADGSRHDRRVDVALHWALTHLKKQGRVVDIGRSVWRIVPVEVKTIAAPVLMSRIEELRAMPYREYLRTPEWRETRRTALVRAGHACQLDLTHTEALEVHHRSYRRLGEEMESDLTVLCHECHTRHHHHAGRPRRPSEPPVSVPPPVVAAVVPAPGRPSLIKRLLAG